MDTYTLFTHPENHFIVHLAIWGSLAFTSALVCYWAATIDNNIENNPSD